MPACGASSDARPEDLVCTWRSLLNRRLRLKVLLRLHGGRFVAQKRPPEMSLDIGLVLLVKTLAVDPSGDEDRSQGDYIAKPDHARQGVGALFRRYVMKPTPQKPKINLGTIPINKTRPANNSTASFELNIGIDSAETN